MSNVLSSFDNWKEFLSDRVAQAKNNGMSEETIKNLAYEIGSFLDEKVDPKNEQQRVLKQLWDAGDEHERKTVAGLMVKLVEQT
ncbi:MULTISPECIES: DUF3243 domain-containing protein [unclassified Paenibacillus]|jgi:Protein of unknown function (DUF3243).|uniref:DUF3243 domain-containing protein n=1 Tax=unclassified Paenibacillus TaxID=185978 RepID=UPI00104E0E82|nr:MULTISPECIES: DUF3243 domain-containing protein [unclassified Paenibacillus]NIK68895.1 hypothetical protein [Paenibacillus sp. BK720]TCM98832.1 uncharacterized protein DUF3243 [Paenibacillus sp. BK033]